MENNKQDKFNSITSSIMKPRIDLMIAKAPTMQEAENSKTKSNSISNKIAAIELFFEVFSWD